MSLLESCCMSMHGLSPLGLNFFFQSTILAFLAHIPIGIGVDRWDPAHVIPKSSFIGIPSFSSVAPMVSLT